jgi:release factor glutamine methyltransferase
VEAPELSAQLLLAESLNFTREQLLYELGLKAQTLLKPDTLERFDQFCSRRLKGEPAAYILGRKEFYGRSFRVNATTLIPRPETELLIDEALKLAANTPNGLFVDLGTGSGCIAITLALELPGWKGLGADISAEACRVAEDNARNMGMAAGLPERLCIIRADFTQNFLRDESLDLLIGNPPYISEDEYASLDAGIRDYEPKTALVPSSAAAQKASGLEYLEIICKNAMRILKPGGRLLLEIGSGQGQAMAALFEQAQIIKDLAGLDRVCLVEKT